MARKKKVITDFDTVMINLAKECIEGKHGEGITKRHNINSLGFGNIYSTVQKYVNMIMAGQL